VARLILVRNSSQAVTVSVLSEDGDITGESGGTFQIGFLRASIRMIAGRVFS
jgi:hypothetical protein